MKNIKLITQHLLLTTVMVAFVACSNKGNNDDDSGRVRSSSGVVPTTFPTNAGSAGVVTNSSSSMMTDAVKKLLVNNALTADQIGSVDASNGVYIAGSVHFDTSNPQRLISTNSYMQLQIWDSIAKAGKAQPFLISIGNNNYGYGTVTYSGSIATADITFKDSMGTIRMYGNFNSSWFTGTVTFANTATGQSGTLGQFQISTCSFFSCQ